MIIEYISRKGTHLMITSRKLTVFGGLSSELSPVALHLVLVRGNRSWRQVELTRALHWREDEA